MKKPLSLILFILFILQGCTNNVPEDKTLSGMGASFPYPFYNTLFSQYKNASGNLIINNGYSSGWGIRALLDQSVDFAGCDAILLQEELAQFDSEVLSIPVCLGAIVLAYNVSEIPQLKLNSSLISDIFLQKITNWNDPEIKKINPELNLPDLPILIIRRSDGSGTNYVFSDYLCKTNPEWEEKMGRGRSLSWHSGIAVSGNILAATTIERTRGSIGYVGQEQATVLNLPYASIQNRAGKYILPTQESILAATSIDYPDDMRVMITDSPNENAYPLSCYSWFYVYKNQAYENRSLEKYNTLKDFLYYSISPEQQKIAGSMSYVPLPEEVVEKAKKQIESLKWEKYER